MEVKQEYWTLPKRIIICQSVNVYREGGYPPQYLVFVTRKEGGQKFLLVFFLKSLRIFYFVHSRTIRLCLSWWYAGYLFVLWGSSRPSELYPKSGGRVGLRPKSKTSFVSGQRRFLLYKIIFLYGNTQTMTIGWTNGNSVHLITFKPNGYFYSDTW